MANITLNIEGDLNIYVSEEDGQPDSLYLDGMDGFPETLRIHLEADGEDDESKAGGHLRHSRRSGHQHDTV